MLQRNPPPWGIFLLNWVQTLIHISAPAAIIVVLGLSTSRRLQWQGTVFYPKPNPFA